MAGPSKDAIKALQDNWRAEIESARTYRELADNEKDARRKAILIRMAEAEEKHAERWKKKLEELGGTLPAVPQPSMFSRLLTRGLGTDAAIRRMEAAEDRHTARYKEQQKEALGQVPGAHDILHEIAIEEAAHAHVLQTMTSTPGPRESLDRILKRERWHGRGGSWVADAIYGVNDGLGSVFGIVSGVAGATENQQRYVLIAGLAGMMASALSMGAGAYLAAKSEREVYEAEIHRESKEVEENPEEEIEEMSLFYQLQGFEEGESKRMAEKLAAEPGQLVKAMAQHELGLSEQNFPSPWISSLSATISTAIGAFIPIVPFFFMSGINAVIVSFAISILSHFVVGAAKSLITTRSWWASGLEMTIVGIIEAAVTYGLGRAFGAIA